MANPGETLYSGKISGNAQNHSRDVRFDTTDGYVGVTAFVEHGVVTDRILLAAHPSRPKTPGWALP